MKTRRGADRRRATKLWIPDLSDIPVYSDIEAACRYAGEVPKGHPDRARYEAHLLRLVERKYSDPSSHDHVAAANADIIALMNYFKGAFNLTGRPFDEERHEHIPTSSSGCSKFASSKTARLGLPPAKNLAGKISPANIVDPPATSSTYSISGDSISTTGVQKFARRQLRNRRQFQA
jgi:hypothetical protein